MYLNLLQRVIMGDMPGCEFWQRLRQDRSPGTRGPTGATRRPPIDMLIGGEEQLHVLGTPPKSLEVKRCELFDAMRRPAGAHLTAHHDAHTGRPDRHAHQQHAGHAGPDRDRDPDPAHDHDDEADDHRADDRRADQEGRRRRARGSMASVLGETHATSPGRRHTQWPRSLLPSLIRGKFVARGYEFTLVQLGSVVRTLAIRYCFP